MSKDEKGSHKHGTGRGIQMRELGERGRISLEEEWHEGERGGGGLEREGRIRTREREGEISKDRGEGGRDRA